MKVSTSNEVLRRPEVPPTKCLNLGCGSRFDPKWINIDASSSSPFVRAHDLTKGLPFVDCSFRVVYHSHVLEHLPRKKALPFLQECHRVLEAGGTLRIAVPDLEQLVRVYLEALEKALRGEEEWKQHYEWAMIKLYDQSVREQSGGAMLEYLQRSTIPNEDFVCRWSGDARRIIQQSRSGSPKLPSHNSRIHRLLTRVRNAPELLRLLILRVLLGPDGGVALSVARFRMSGEIHHWMYDQYSLANLLRQAGFEDARKVGPTESYIPSWADYHLDTDPNGTVYKPDSLYMEAIKN
jgi:predicted SAM-dependent methyltransferase